MQAAVFEGIRTIRVQTIPDPEPTVDDIVIRVKACGICGSDLHSYTSGAFVKPGQVMGHEFCGEVVTVGANVQGLVVGERVTAMPLNACYTCAACTRGETHLCLQRHGSGHCLWPAWGFGGISPHSSGATQPQCLHPPRAAQ